jgi:hypothetical protein
MEYDDNFNLNLTLEEFENISGVDVDLQLNKAYMSTECVGDMYIYLKTMFLLRSGDISEEEWEDYSRYDDRLEAVDLTEARTRIGFIDQEEPYSYFDYGLNHG